MHLTLPWPPSDLSPNRRNHWRKGAKLKATYRDRCRIEALSQQPNRVPAGPLSLLLEFVPPDRRRRDRDNLLASMKAGLDGLADALRIDDSRFDTVTIRVAEPAKGRQCVRVTIAPLAREPFLLRDAAGVPTSIGI